jgi:hypothetical protein
VLSCPFYVVTPRRLSGSSCGSVMEVALAPFLARMSRIPGKGKGVAGGRYGPYPAAVSIKFVIKNEDKQQGDHT